MSGLRFCLSAAITAALLTAASASLAASGPGQDEGTGTSRIPKSNWRQHDRTVRSPEGPYLPGTFRFELRFGPYCPEVDEEFGGAARPYVETFAEGVDDDPTG